MENDRSEQFKMLPDESEPLKGNDGHNSTSQFDKKGENNKKETADEEDSSSSDKPGGEVRVDEDSGASLGQGMDDSLQLVSLVCHIRKACQESEPICNEFDIRFCHRELWWNALMSHNMMHISSSKFLFTGFGCTLKTDYTL